jgi:hypothetical protein
MTEQDSAITYYNDHFESHCCVSCGGTAALFAVPPDEYLAACSHCLVDRIGKPRGILQEVPDWVRILESEAHCELGY